jgi:hypothetical protein
MPCKSNSKNLIKFMLRFIPTLLTILILTCCKSSKNKEVTENKIATSAAPKTSTQAEKASPAVHNDTVVKSKLPQIEQQPKTTTSELDSTLYSLVVSFYSIGEGIDFKVAKEYNQMLSAYTTKEGILLNFDKVSWGREGETDFCIRLNGLSKKEKEIFIKKSQEILKKTKLVHTKENASCRQKRPR